jgi:hypothetical protein
MTLGDRLRSSLKTSETLRQHMLSQVGWLKEYLGPKLSAVASPKGRRYIGLSVRACLVCAAIIYTGIVLVQLSGLSQNISYVTYIFLTFLGILLLGSTFIGNKLAIGLLAGLLLLIGIYIRWKSVIFFDLKPISDLLITYNNAQKWTEGPSLSLHNFIFPHWGVYALFLKSWFDVFNDSVLSAKMLNLVASLVMMAAVAALLYLDPLRRRSVVGIITLSALYPTFAFYTNFLSGEILFMSLFAVGLLGLSLASRSTATVQYYGCLSIFILCLVLASLLKQLAVIMLPLAALCVTYMLYVRRDYARILPSLATIAIISVLLPMIIYGRLEHYAKGPVNKHGMYLFLASGLSQNTGGQLDSRYYDPYVANLTKAYYSGHLTDGTYQMEGEKMRSVVVSELKDYWGLPGLFDQKVKFVWTDDSNISFWFYTADSSRRSYIKPFFDAISKVFYLAISMLFMLNILRTFRDSRYDIVNLYAIFFVCLYIAASLFIEGQARYRIILIPALLIGASGGLMYLHGLLPKLKRKFLNLSR